MALRLDVRQSVPLPRLLGQPVRGQGLLSTAPAARRGRRRAGEPAQGLHQGRGEAAHRGDDGPRDQSHVQGFGAGRGAPGVVPPRPRWRAALAARDRSDRSAQVHRVGRPRRDRLRQSEHAPGAGRVLGGAGRAPPEARLQGVPLRRRLPGAGRGVAADRAPGEGARSGVPVLRRDARLHAGAGAGAARRRASTSCSTAPSGGTSARPGCSSSTISTARSRRPSPSPRATTPSASPWSSATPSRRSWSGTTVCAICSRPRSRAA